MQHNALQCSVKCCTVIRWPGLTQRDSCNALSWPLCPSGFLCLPSFSKPSRETLYILYNVRTISRTITTSTPVSILERVICLFHIINEKRLFPHLLPKAKFYCLIKEPKVTIWHPTKFRYFHSHRLKVNPKD